MDHHQDKAFQLDRFLTKAGSKFVDGKRLFDDLRLIFPNVTCIALA